MKLRFLIAVTALLSMSPTLAQAPAQGPGSSQGLGTATGQSQRPATAVAENQLQPPKPAPDRNPNKQCVSNEDFDIELRSNARPVGDTLVIETRYLPTGQRVEVGVRTPFVEGVRYFAAIAREDGYRRVLNRQDVVTRRAVASDNLVKSKQLEADQTLVTIELETGDAGFWQVADLYVYTCAGSPARVSRLNIVLGPYRYSLWATILAVVILYGLLAWYLRKHDGTFQSYLSALNPAKLSAGPDGKGSLSKFQVLGFSFLVFALILLLLLQTGELSDLSATVLALLGINGFGATLAKGADGSRNVLTSDNRAWLLRHNWLPVVQQPVDNSNAVWRDFFTTDREFDVYRFQSFIFSLVVGGAMITAGVGQLSTFSIPETVLGIVGLSQAVYIGGKLVTPTTMKALNDALDDLRDREKKLRAAAITANNGAPVTSLADGARLAAASYADYRQRAADVRSLYLSETGLAVQDADLAPKFDL